jgi:hypothetical protein
MLKLCPVWPGAVQDSRMTQPLWIFVITLDAGGVFGGAFAATTSHWPSQKSSWR